MQHTLDFDYSKLHLKEVTVLMPKYHPNINSFLTPILGLHGINVKDFITDFENKTKFIDLDLVIPTRVRISKIKSFEIILKTPYLSEILFNIEDFNLLHVYKASLIKNIYLRDGYIMSLPTTYLNIRKYISNIFKKNFSVFKTPKIIIRNNSFIKFFNEKIKKLNFYKKIETTNYGAIICFNNLNAYYLEIMRKNLVPLKIEVFKSYNNILNRFTFSVNSHPSNLYFNSRFLNTIIDLFDYFFKKKSSSIILLHARVNNNLLRPTFFKQFFSDIIRKNNFVFTNIIFKLMRIILSVLFSQIKINAHFSSIN